MAALRDELLFRTDEAMIAPIPICFPLAGDLPVGGGHVSILLLLQNLDRRRYQPIIAVHGDGPVRRWLAQQGLAHEIEDLGGRARVKRGAWIRNAACICLRSWGWARFLRERSVAVVHVNDTIMLETWALAARMSGAKLLWHKRGPWSDRWLHRLWFRVADHVIAISRFAAPPNPSPQCSTVYNPVGNEQGQVDRAASRQALVRELGLQADVKVLGFFADIDKERKRPDVFVETVALVAARMPQVPVVGLLFGQCSPSTQRSLHALAERLGVAGRVHFMGFRYPPAPWYAACDLLVVPSVGEGFGRTLIEAMLVGTIAVAAASGGHREIITNGETGFLVPPDDARAFADRVCEVLGRPDELAALAPRARQDAIQRFGTQHHARSVMAVYKAMSSDRWRPARALVGALPSETRVAGMQSEP